MALNRAELRKRDAEESAILMKATGYPLELRIAFGLRRPATIVQNPLELIAQLGMALDLSPTHTVQIRRADRKHDPTPELTAKQKGFL